MSADPAVVFLGAGQAFLDLCERIDEEQWDQPGLGDWDVRALVGHTLRALTTVPTYLAAATPDAVVCRSAGEYFARARTVAGADDAAVAARGHRAGRDLGDEPVETVREGLATARAALETVDDDPVIATVVGGMRLRDYLPTRTFELVAHGLDLGAATGLAFTPPPAALASALHTTVAALTETGDGAAVLRHLLGRPDAPLPPLFDGTGAAAQPGSPER